MSKKRRKPQPAPQTDATPIDQPQPDGTPDSSKAAQRPQTLHGQYFLFFLIAVSLIACYLLIQPYIHAILLAGILSILAYPLHRRIARVCGGRTSLAAFLTSALLTLIVLIPLLFVIFALLQQGAQVFNAIYDWVSTGAYKRLLEHPWVVSVSQFSQKYVPDAQKYFPNFNLEQIRLENIMLQTSSKIGKNLLNQGGNLLSNITSLIMQFFLMLFTFFFMVRDQESMFKGLLHLIPLSRSQENEIIEKVRSVAKSVLLGTLVTALLQGLSGGIAFYIAHLPALFWGTMIAFASLIPMVGTALIWVPAAVYLFLSGHWGYALFMVCWCIPLVSSIDNFVRPMFMQGAGRNMSMLVIFFSLLGGINYFGLIGLLYGPLIVGLTMVFLYIYSLEFREFLNQQDHR